MTDLLDFIVGEIASVVFSESVTWVRDHIEQKKRLANVKAGFERILQDEQKNWYYHDLSRVLMSGNLFSDIMNGYLTGQPLTNVEERINTLLVHNHIIESKHADIKGVIWKMIACMDAVMLKPSDGEEARTAYRFNGIQGQLDEFGEYLRSFDARIPVEPSNNLSLADIEGHCEQTMDTSTMVARKLIENESNDTNNNRLCWSEIIRTERHIAIVNNAGEGKTYALHQICSEAKAQGYSPVYLSLRKYPGIPLFEKLQTQRFSDSQKVVLILDGYDEIKPECLAQFIAALDSIGDRFTDMTIVLSARSNFFAHHPLPYKLYRLASITEQERIEYVRERGVDTNAFFKQVRERRLDAVCENAFYFVELVQLWEINNELPDEANIMDTIVSSRMHSDWEKYRLSVPELSKHMASLRKLLERSAFIMQCTHRVQLTQGEMERICSKEKCDQLKLHGIWENDDSNNWGFTHNNFREYFAACWLKQRSLDQIVSHISWSKEKPTIRPSWTNVLAYLAKIRGSRDLQEWIAKNDPSVITLFEKERFSSDERFEIFKRIYDQHEVNLTWADIDYSVLKRLGAFVSSGAAVEYVLDKLTKRLHTRQAQNLLRIMEYFDSLYGFEDECRLIIGGIAFDDSYLEHVRTDALDVMCRFPQVFAQYVEQAAEKCMLSGNMNYRKHLQYFIDAAEKLDEHFEVIIHELKQPEKEDDIHDVGRDLFLEKVCSTVKAPNTVLQLFKFACEHLECVDQSPFKEAWKNLFDIAAHCDAPYQKELLHVVLKLFFGLRHRYDPCLDELIKGYMLEANAEEAFLESILSDDDVDKADAICSILSSDFVEMLIQYYNTERLADPNIIEQVIRHMSDTNSLRGKLIHAVYIKTGVEIVIPEVVDHEQMRRKGQQTYFDALFSKSAFAALVGDLCEMFGRDALVRESSYVICEPWDRKTALSQCLRTLRSAVPKEAEITLGGVIEWIKDWEWFQYCHVSRAIDTHKDITLSASQREWMETYTHNKLSEMNIDEIVKEFVEESRYDPSVRIVFRTMVQLDMSLELDFLSSLIFVPSFMFGESDPTAFPQYLLKHIPEEMMSEQVLHNLQCGELREEIVVAHLNYCTEHKLYGAKDFALEFLSRDESEGYRYSAVQYISELYGEQVIIDEVVPLRDDEHFLRDIAYHIPRRLPATLFDEKLDAILNHNPASGLLELMIQRNHRNALEMYYAEAARIKTLPDMTIGSRVPTLTEAIRCVNNIELLDIIIALLRLCNNSDFKDKEHFGLCNSCWEAIKSMASTNYDDVKNALVTERDQSSDNQKLTCIDLLQRIDEWNQTQIDKGIGFELALALTDD